MNADPDLYTGGWLDEKTGRFHLDLAKNVQDEAAAVQIGKDNDQIAIFNLNDFTEIRLKGSELHPLTEQERRRPDSYGGENGRRDQGGAGSGKGEAQSEVGLSSRANLAQDTDAYLSACGANSPGGGGGKLPHTDDAVLDLRRHLAKALEPRKLSWRYGTWFAS